MFYIGWVVSNRYPRAPKDKLGLTIAITVQNPEKEKQIRTDFIERLRKLLEVDQGDTQFHVIVAANHIAESITTYREADELAEKTKSTFVLWGNVGLRQVRRGDFRHYFNIGAVVRYRKAPNEINAEIKKDFSVVVPERILLDLENEILVFEATSELLAIGASYIIAIASMVNGNLTYSEKLLEAVQEKRKQLRVSGDIPNYIDKKLPTRFADLYTSWHSHVVKQFNKTRDHGLLAELERLADKAILYDQNYYNAYLTKAICAFILRRNLSEARKSIEKCRALRTKDGTWLLSSAFLYAYAGRLKASRKDYSRAFAEKTTFQDTTVFTQTEEFIERVLQEEPHKTDLWFCLGLINFFGKNDSENAKRDLQKFLDLTPETPDNSKFRKEAQELISKCDERVL